jgi:anti-sigma regulatory factor (Ser/Thr protein kinase)/putative methionine-R-sulfoxide reductase with GAF domain
MPHPKQPEVGRALPFRRPMNDATQTKDATGRLRQIEALTDSALAHLDVEELLSELLERVRDVLHVDTAAVLLLDRASNSLIATAARGIEEEVIQGVRIPVGRGFAGRIAAEKRAVILDRVDHTNVLNPILRDRGIRSLLGVPLRSQGEVLGVLHVGTLSPRKFTEDDAELLHLVADRVALATQARLNEADRSAAIALQNSLLPGRLPQLHGLEFAARYVPGEAGGVGGDWYDVFSLPSGRLCVVMGDVVGRGLRAAVVMGRLRSTLRAYSLMTEDPAEVIARVDRKLQHFEPGEMATIMMTVFDPSYDTITISCAGHPPPVMARANDPATVLELPVDPPIGVFANHRRRNTTIEIPRGAVLCLFTDGLVERRDATLDERFDELCQAVQADAPDAVCAAVMLRMVGSTTPKDDIAVLTVRRTDDSRTAPLDIHVAAVPTSLGQIRVALRRWLATVGATDDDANDILVAVGEATANAVEHAYGAAGGVVEVHVDLEDRDVVIRVRDSGQWRAPRGEHRGRGTMIMEKTSDTFHLIRGENFTEVIMRRRLST